MAGWDDGYVAASLHDLGKLLLNQRSGNKGSWGGDHAHPEKLLEKLDSNSPNHKRLAAALSAPLETPGQAELIANHHRKFNPDYVPPPDLTLPWLALQFADGAHKSLYHVGEAGPLDNVNLYCPRFYPFWGERQAWNPEQGAERYLSLAEEIQAELKAGRPLDAKFLTGLGEKGLSDFLETTYLPVISMHFHHQLSAALYLMARARLEGDQVAVHEELQPGGSGLSHVHLGVDLVRVVVSVPAERLRYRLRDAMHLRKVSRWLLGELHLELKERYLGGEVAGRKFDSPDVSPFIFYGKDAIVLLCREDDLAALEARAQRVADETETPIRLELEHIGLQARRAGNLVHKQPADLCGQAVRLAAIQAEYRGSESRWVMPAVQTALVGAHECACCHKPLGDNDYTLDYEDKLCRTCATIRLDYRECGECGGLFPNPRGACPVCGNPKVEPPARPGMIAALQQKEQEGRLALVAVRIGALPRTMGVESDLRLAEFRQERWEQEDEILQKECGLGAAAATEKANAARPWLPVVHSTGTVEAGRAAQTGVLEYLQAVLEIGQRQQAWGEWLAETLYAGQEHPKRSADAHFVYRSPSLTVLLVAEEQVAAVCRRVRKDLAHLHLAHRLDVVTCGAHHPLRDALSSIFESRSLRVQEVERPDPQPAVAYREGAVRARAATTDRRTARRQLWDTLQQPALAAAQHPLQGVRLRVLRGGDVRSFEGEMAEELLAWGKMSGASAAQLSALAQAAESMAATMPAVGDAAAGAAWLADVKENLLLELEARLTRERLGEETARRLAEHVRRLDDPEEVRTLACFLRELAAHR